LLQEGEVTVEDLFTESGASIAENSLDGSLTKVEMLGACKDFIAFKGFLRFFKKVCC
jgi:hypothetical protein